MAIRPESDFLDSVYCSKECQIKMKAQSQSLLFSLDSPLPPEMAPPMPPQAVEERNKAQKAFAAYLNNAAKSVPLLVARFIARQVAAETAKMTPTSPSAPLTSDIFAIDGGEYTLYDHIERLRYLEVPAPEDEMKLLREVLQHALPGLEQFVTDERHATLLGKMGYNIYGVCFGGGRDDKVSMILAIESISLRLDMSPATVYGTSGERRKDSNALWYIPSNRLWTLSSVLVCKSCGKKWSISPACTTILTPNPDIALLCTYHPALLQQWHVRTTSHYDSRFEKR
jgi:hypothetical protein